MATNIIKNGNLDADFKVGSSDCKIYLGDVLLYPHTPSATKFYAEYSNGDTATVNCNSSSELIEDETKPMFSPYYLMTSAEIGDCVTTIGANAFQSCTSLSSITISSSVTSIGSAACYSCYALSSVIIPDGVTSIGNQAFQYCSGLTDVTIGSGVTSIGVLGFQSCTNLSSLTIPDSVTTIGQQAFEGCFALSSVTIGSGVTSIGGGAFGGCSALTSVTINATTPPTLGGSVFTDTNDCPIYVPSASVEIYKAASIWSDYASRIQAI